MALEPKLIKLFIVKGAEFRCQATEGPDKPELRSDETKPSLLIKLEAMLDFTLHLNERISRCQKVRVQIAATGSCKNEIARCVRGLESPMYQVTASPDVFRPWHDVTSEIHIRPCLRTLQVAFFDQFIAELTESKSGLVVAEVWAGYHAQAHTGEGRTVATAMLEAEINHPTNDQRIKIRVRKSCRWQDLGQNIHCREGRRIAHQG